MPRFVTTCVACCLFLPTLPLLGQVSEMDLINRVEALQADLASDRVSERQTAEADLIDLGPKVLDYLDEPGDEATGDLRERLARVRKQLETVAAGNTAKPSLISLNGKSTVEATLASMASQTGNDIALSDQVPADLGQKTIDLTLSDVTFWQAMQAVQQKARLQIDPYAASARQLRLIPRDDQGVDGGANSHTVVETSAGVFHFQVNRVDASHHLLTPRLSTTRVHLLVRWEPRVRPITIKLAAEHIAATDADKQPLPVANPKAIFSALVQPQIPQLEVQVPLKQIDRSVKEIASFKARFESTLPGRTETFRFKRAGKQTPGTQLAKAGATVTLEGVDKNEDLYGITITLAFDEELNALESHQSWVFENRVWLLDEQDQRSEPLTYETIRQDNSGVTVTYYFADDPANRTLIYETPAAIVQSVNEIELKNIPLP